MIPRATMRLQFNKDFGFADAEAIVPYLANLGVSHLYASPIATARAASSHGYDVVDPTRVNPELGGEDALRRLAAWLREHGMGMIVDIVPNHMAASLENAWWADVLRHGRRSRYARFFDIDWEPEDPRLHGRVFLPVLDRPLDEALGAGEIVPVTRADGDYFQYRGLLLPRRGNDPGQQAYQLGWWQTAGDCINWRRFFDINDLVCLRMDDDEAFEAVHRLTKRLYGEGVIEGIRIDHVDGLADPAGYCRKLRRHLDPDHPDRPYLVVEKILLRGETLPADWQCQGTTGYDFMDEVNALQHDPLGEPVLTRSWSALSGRPGDFAVEEEAARREILGRSFAAQLEACARAFEGASEVSRPALRRALTELLVHFPVYRTYGASTGWLFLQRAVAAAKRTALAQDRWLLDRLDRCMSAPGADGTARTRFQQLSAPLAAKAVEDTAFYRYGRLLSRNDVGFDVERFGSDPAEFHDRMQRRRETFPHAMLATATHDQKRGEDMRARLAVLSERAGAWTSRLAQWIEQVAPLCRNGMPAAGDLVMLFQTIAGAWPLDLALDDIAGRNAFAQRLVRWQQKALREAKLNSDWTEPNQAYETAAAAAVERLLGGNERSELLGDIFAFVQEIAAVGAVNGLAQTLLKLTVPGVPDLYQGSDYWDFSLVDPDNRRPVAFDERARSLAATGLDDALVHWRDGRLKQWIVARALALRRQLPELFAIGSYEPIAARGELSEHIVAFARRAGNDAAIVVVPRLPGTLIADRDKPMLAADAWLGTSLDLPDLPLFDALHAAGAQEAQRNLALRDVFAALPVALFSTRPPPSLFAAV
jgi:malto-oligosyltrehalose synthase